MPWNLLIFPLSAGYYILTRSFYFKFRQQRLDRQRLIFESIFIGTFLGGIAYTISILMHVYLPGWVVFIKSFIPFKIPYLLAAASTLIFAMIFSKLGNRFLDKQKYIQIALKRYGNELELLLSRSVQQKELLLFTLTNNKSYVGWVKELPIPSVSNYVRITPAISGYRDNEMDLIFTSQYLEYYSKIIQSGEIQDIKELNADIIIDMDDIITACNFDMKMYGEMSVKHNENTE